MPTVKFCWDRYRDQHLINTVHCDKNARYWNQLKWFQRFDAEAITPMEVHRYLQHRGYPKTQASTLNRELALLRACLRFAERERYIRKAPIIKALRKPATRVSALTKVQAQDFLKAAEKRNIWQEKAFIMLALGTGQRPGAILDLTWDKIAEDVIDFRSNHPMVARMKGRAVVPLNDLSRRALVIADRHREGDRVLHCRGRRISRITRLVHNVAKEAGIPCTPHMLRHTVASVLLQDGADLLPVSRLLGHANTMTTQTVYFQHQPAWLKGVVDKLEF